MNQNFKIPSYFPIPQSVFDKYFSRSLGCHYALLTFLSEVTDEPAIQAWVHDNRILSDAESKKIIYHDTGDIAGGYYSLNDKWIPFSKISFIKKKITKKGETVWEAEDIEIIEKDGVIISGRILWTFRIA